MPIIFKTRIRTGNFREEPQWISVTRRGSSWQDGETGETIELFRIAVLAEALDRTAYTLRKWTKQGLIPKPVFVPQGEKCVHWYTAAQIINCHRLSMSLFNGLKHRRADSAETLTKEITKIWYSKNVVVPLKEKAA